MILFYGLAGLIVVCDQLTKYLALTRLTGDSVPLVPGVLHLTLVKNTGAAFGLMNEHSSLLFAVITVSLVFLFIFANRSHGAGLRERWALSLIVGGAIGNWIDRIRFGAVVDFLDFRVWPVFNLADSAITIGVCLYFFDVFFSKRTGKKP